MMGQLPTEMSGVGAHHQNAIEERTIGTITRSAYTMLLHAAIYWPETSDLMLWPFAMQYTVQLLNKLPHPMTGLSPLEIFCGVKSYHSDLLKSHVWGYPAYVLHPTLQDGKKLPKWNPRERCGQFLGWSTQHAANTALIRNLQTGSITVMDDWFTTIAKSGADEDFTPPDNWDDSIQYDRLNCLSDWDIEIDGQLPQLSIEWMTEWEQDDAWRLHGQTGPTFISLHQPLAQQQPPQHPSFPEEDSIAQDELQLTAPQDNDNTEQQQTPTEPVHRYPQRAT